VYGDPLYWNLFAVILLSLSHLVSSGRGFFPALVSRNDGVVLLFLLHCFDALEYFLYCADIPPVLRTVSCQISRNYFVTVC
jgi:hypothetical protein